MQVIANVRSALDCVKHQRAGIDTTRMKKKGDFLSRSRLTWILYARASFCRRKELTAKVDILATTVGMRETRKSRSWTKIDVLRRARKEIDVSSC